MAEYIEREKAKEYLADEYAYAAAEVIDRVPAADVVEVVRCKDCVHASQHKYSPAFFVCGGCNFLRGRLVSSDFYCKCGERRAEE